MDAARRNGVAILPVDSEHNAIHQCLHGHDVHDVARLILTASGGLFRGRSASELERVTADEALRHQTWRMGRKITIDSATVMNKGLEIIEAHFLFDVDYPRIDVAIHPRSLVHSYVEFCDGATVAQLGVPDMRVPIALAMADGERLPGVGPPLELRGGPALEFLPVDERRFPAVALAREAGEAGGVRPALLNAANEVAVAAFLEGECRFDELVPLVAGAVGAAPTPAHPSLEDIVNADAWAREHVSSVLERRVAAG